MFTLGEVYSIKKKERNVDSIVQHLKHIVRLFVLIRNTMHDLLTSQETTFFHKQDDTKQTK